MSSRSGPNGQYPPRRMSRLSNSYQGSRRASKQPTFILVNNDEDDQVTCFSLIGNMGIPLLYIVTIACLLMGIITMSVITKYWAGMDPPQCFLYSRSASSEIFYQFGTKLSTCNWVAYGGILPLIIAVVSGILYIAHVKDDKELDIISYGVVTAMFIAAILMLSVSCTYSQGLRITCAEISINLFNSRVTNCKERLDNRVLNYNLPVTTSSMINASLSTLWIATVGFILISSFHIAMVIRRRIRDGEPY